MLPPGSAGVQRRFALLPPDGGGGAGETLIRLLMRETLVLSDPSLSERVLM